MKNKMKNDDGKVLFVVNYVRTDSLEEVESIRTHSFECAVNYARYLIRFRDRVSREVLYSQVVVYRYNADMKVYQFVTLYNFYNMEN